MHHPRNRTGLGQRERPEGGVVGHVQVQYVGSELANRTRQRGPKSDGNWCIDQMALHRHAYQPIGVIGQRVAMHQGARVQALGALGGHQIGQKNFHAASVGRIELAYVQYGGTHGVSVAHGQQPLGRGCRGSVDYPAPVQWSDPGLSGWLPCCLLSGGPWPDHSRPPRWGFGRPAG